MKDIHIDTVKIRNCGNEIIKISVQMNEIINAMFNRINNMPTTTGEWVGPSANEYAQRANLEKRQYTVFANELYAKGKYLIDYANAMEQKISEVVK